ncbi:MAG: ABC transporter ATP-binding protein [Campylobacteraceae bacterium 4484_4]|nr:MAG: ABC transporter ATP-binding protein [Campylobacteraceae bacterium 4484_4]
MRYTFRDIFKELLHYRGRLISANLIAVLAVLVATPAPLLIPLLVDEVLLHKPGRLLRAIDTFFAPPHESWFYILVVLGMTVTLRALFFLFSVWQNWHFSVISKNITYEIRRALLRHIERVSLSEFESMGSGRIASLMVVDVATIEQFLGVSISRLIISVLTVVGVAAVLLWIHWQLALFILLLNPFIILLTTKIGRKVGRLKKAENAKTAIFQEALSETLDLFWQVRASNREGRFMQALVTKASEIKEAAIAFGFKSDAAARFSFLLFLSGFEVFRAAGIMMVAYSDLTIGLMLAIFGYLWVIMTPVQEIIGIQYAYHNAKAALNRINEIFAMEKEPEYPHLKNPFRSHRTDSIEIENLSFSYANKIPVLKSINMRIDRGAKVAIVGASGSGKTTLAQLIVGFYYPREGDIRYDGVSFREIGLDVIREHVYLVLQHPMLFNDTIRFNLTFGKEVSEEKIKEALKIAQMEDFIDNLEEGLETQVGKNGIKLSGGQRQRLSIARMVIADPNVIILDESTSALDMHTENRLFDALSEYLKERTTIIIAHRLSTIKNADYIYVMEEGEIEEEGTFDALMAQEGRFASYYHKTLPKEQTS